MLADAWHDTPPATGQSPCDLLEISLIWGLTDDLVLGRRGVPRWPRPVTKNSHHLSSALFMDDSSGLTRLPLACAWLPLRKVSLLRCQDLHWVYTSILSSLLVDLQSPIDLHDVMRSDVDALSLLQ